MKPARSPHPGRSLAALLSGLLLTSCYSLLPSNGGGQTAPRTVRLIRPADVAVPAGYRVEALPWAQARLKLHTELQEMGLTVERPRP